MRKSHFFIIGLICILASSMIVNDDMLAYAMTDIEDFVDNNSSDIDNSPDIGSHSNFPAEQAHDSSFDTLTETLTVTPPIEDFVDNNSSNVDGISDVGTHSNFTNMKAKDDIYDTLNESGGSIIYEDSAEGYSTAGVDLCNFSYSLQKGSGNDRLVVVTVSWEDNNPLTSVASCTFNSVEMTKIADVANTSGPYTTYVSLWYLLDSSLPSSSGPYYVTATTSELISREIYVGVAEYSGVKQSAPDDYDTHSHNLDGNTQITLTAATDNSLVVAGVGEGGVYALTNTNNLIVLQEQVFFSEGSAIGHNLGVNSGDITVGWNNLQIREAMIGAVWQPATQDYHLDLEVQFTNVTDFLEIETLCIYAGTVGTEDISVDYWNGTGWENVFTDLTGSSWNNASVSVTSSNFTIRFNGTIESGDTTQDWYLIDCVLLRLEGDGHNEIVVQNQDSDVDGIADAGEIIDFSNMTAYDASMALLNETVQTGGDPNEYSIDLTSGYIRSTTADIGVAAGTISFWIKFDSTTLGRPVGMNGDEELRLSDSILYADWGEDTSFTSDTTFTTGTWYFVGVTWEETANNLFVYIGTETTTPSLDAGSPAAGSWGGTTSTIPQATVYWGNGYGFSQPVDGHMDDIRFYDTVRTLSEIRSDYNQTLTGTETGLVNYYELENDYTDSAGNDDGTLFGTGAFSTDVPSWEVGGDNDFVLTQEVQWTDIPSNLPNEYLCIYTGSTGAEDILVDTWNGTDWENIFADLTANSWNNISITDSLISSTFTIRFRDGNTSGDSSTQDKWEIDVALLHIWQEATVYKLDLEVQWTGAENGEYYEELCIKTGTTDAEDILVDVWNGSQWQEVFSDLNPNVWNNVSVTSYLLSNTFTIRYRGGSETSDNNQDQWEIDAVLLHTWTPFDQEPPNISWGSNQFANDTGTHQVHIDLDAEDIYYGSGIDTAWYRIWNVSASEWVSGHNNVSLVSPDYEIDVDVSTWHPSTEYYVEAFANDTGGYENATQSIIGDKNRHFTIVHNIVVSIPAVSYSGGSIQELDISVATATCSYAAHGPLDFSSALVHNYTVYTIGESPTGITGNLFWTGTWQAFDIDVSGLPDGTYYVKCYFEDLSGHTGTSSASSTFTKSISNGGGGNGGGDGSSDGSGGGGDGSGDGTSTSTFILDFLNNFYGTKPGETVTLSGNINSNENGQLITITFEGETYTAYTYNNGEFEVTLTAPNIYGSYPVTAKFAGDSNWESTITTCTLLVVEEETQMTLNIDDNPEIGEQITIQITLTTENGDPIPGEKITIYIYERKNSISTSSFLMSSGVRVFLADTRYWDLIATYEVTTDENSKAIIELTISTDNDIQIVAEYAGKIEGEGGVNLGPSIATYVEGETGQTLFVLMPSEMWYLFGGILATVIVIGLFVVMKPNLLSVIIHREKNIETALLSQEMLDPTRYGVKAVFMIAFDPVIGPIIKESRFFDFEVEFFQELLDPAKLTLFYSMSSTRKQFKLEELHEFIFVKAATTLIINEADMTVLGETVAPNLFIVITNKECNENFVWKFINTILIGWPDHQGYLAHQMDRLNSENMIDLSVLSFF